MAAGRGFGISFIVGPIYQQCCVLLAAQVVDTVDVKEPWNTPGAAELDAITFQSW